MAFDASLSIECLKVICQGGPRGCSLHHVIVTIHNKVNDLYSIPSPMAASPLFELSKGGSTSKSLIESSSLFSSTASFADNAISNFLIRTILPSLSTLFYVFISKSCVNLFGTTSIAAGDSLITQVGAELRQSDRNFLFRSHILVLSDIWNVPPGSMVHYARQIIFVIKPWVHFRRLGFKLTSYNDESIEEFVIALVASKWEEGVSLDNLSNALFSSSLLPKSSRSFEILACARRLCQRRLLMSQISPRVSDNPEMQKVTETRFFYSRSLLNSLKTDIRFDDHSYHLHKLPSLREQSLANDNQHSSSVAHFVDSASKESCTIMAQLVSLVKDFDEKTVLSVRHVSKTLRLPFHILYPYLYDLIHERVIYVMPSTVSGSLSFSLETVVVPNRPTQSQVPLMKNTVKPILSRAHVKRNASLFSHRINLSTLDENIMGYHSSVVGRARLLHEFLCSELWKADDNEKDVEVVNGRECDVFGFIRHMPLALFCRCIGIRVILDTVSIDQHPRENYREDNLEIVSNSSHQPLVPLSKFHLSSMPVGEYIDEVSPSLSWPPVTLHSRLMPIIAIWRDNALVYTETRTNSNFQKFYRRVSVVISEVPENSNLALEETLLFDCASRESRYHLWQSIMKRWFLNALESCDPCNISNASRVSAAKKAGITVHEKVAPKVLVSLRHYFIKHPPISFTDKLAAFSKSINKSSTRMANLIGDMKYLDREYSDSLLYVRSNSASADVSSAIDIACTGDGDDNEMVFTSKLPAYLGYLSALSTENDNVNSKRKRDQKETCLILDDYEDETKNSFNMNDVDVIDSSDSGSTKRRKTNQSSKYQGNVNSEKPKVQISDINRNQNNTTTTIRRRRKSASNITEPMRSRLMEIYVEHCANAIINSSPVEDGVDWETIATELACDIDGDKCQNVVSSSLCTGPDSLVQLLWMQECILDALWRMEEQRYPGNHFISSSCPRALNLFRGLIVSAFSSPSCLDLTSGVVALTSAYTLVPYNKETRIDRIAPSRFEETWPFDNDVTTTKRLYPLTTALEVGDFCKLSSLTRIQRCIADAILSVVFAKFSFRLKNNDENDGNDGNNDSDNEDWNFSVANLAEIEELNACLREVFKHSGWKSRDIVSVITYLLNTEPVVLQQISSSSTAWESLCVSKRFLSYLPDTVLYPTSLFSDGLSFRCHVINCISRSMRLSHSELLGGDIFELLNSLSDNTITIRPVLPNQFTGDDNSDINTINGTNGNTQNENSDIWSVVGTGSVPVYGRKQTRTGVKSHLATVGEAKHFPTASVDPSSNEDSKDGVADNEGDMADSTLVLKSCEVAIDIYDPFISVNNKITNDANFVNANDDIAADIINDDIIVEKGNDDISHIKSSSDTLHSANSERVQFMLSFLNVDTNTATRVTQVLTLIRARAEDGVKMTELRQFWHETSAFGDTGYLGDDDPKESNIGGIWSLDTTLSYLISFGIIIRFNAEAEHVYLSEEFIRGSGWSVIPQNESDNEADEVFSSKAKKFRKETNKRVGYRALTPWISPSGQPNTDIIMRMASSIVAIVIRHPGISQQQLLFRLSASIIGVRNVLDIIDAVVESGAIRRLVLFSPSPSIFNRNDSHDKLPLTSYLPSSVSSNCYPPEFS